MNRRDFLLMVPAVPLLAVPLPAIEQRPALVINKLKPLIDAVLGQALRYEYFFVVHPRQYAALLRSQALHQWRSAYRAWREDGRRDALTCREILQRFGNPLHTMKGEVGTINGMQIICTQKRLTP